METQPFRRIERAATEEERQRHAEIRAKVQEEIPPTSMTAQESPPGFPAQIREVRESKGLTWYALANLAGIPNSNTVRDIEQGRDAPLSTVLTLAKALGLRLELVEEKEPTMAICSSGN